MLVHEHIQTAQDFLETANREFEAGDILQGSEKMWGAASHAVMAVSQRRGWPFGSHNAMREAARRLAGEYNDPFIEAAFGVAEKFHANFYHDFMESEERQSSAASVRLLVTRLTAMTDDDRNGSDQSQ
ncbi:MAG: hypothetical protein F4Z35_00625 [Dehalococcoidia bacterium]|nr:hypothetical protein [Dehalococcoidia bacterium]